MSKRALISVVITCYNLGEYIIDAIESVKAQTYQDFEIIVVDDGSTDSRTVAVLDELKEDKVQIFRTKNEKLPKARNYGIKQSNGHYIVCLDADDMLAPEYLEKAIKVMENDKVKNVGFVTSWIREIGERHSHYKTDSFDITKMLKTNLVHVASMFKKDVWVEVGGYNESMIFGYEDWDFWLSFVELGYKWEIIPEPLFMYRIRDNSMLSSARNMHIDLYSKIYDLHTDLFKDNYKSLLIQYAKDDEAKKKQIAQQDSVIGMNSKQIMHLQEQNKFFEQEIKAIKESPLIGRAIKLARIKALVFEDVRLNKGAGIRRKFYRKTVAKPYEKVRNIYRSMRIQYIQEKNDRITKKQPLVSVIIPYFNRHNTIFETLDSLVNQTFTNFEVVLVDDGSTDFLSINDLKEIENYPIKPTVIRTKNGGVSKARNKGIENSTGKLIMCLDSDDIIDSRYIEKCALVLESDPNISLVSTGIQAFGVSEWKHIHKNYDPSQLLAVNMASTASMFRRKAWLDAGGYKSSLGYEDWDFWLAMAEKGHWGRSIPELLFRYRTASSSRYVEDKAEHDKNIKKIHSHHPNYMKLIKKLKAERRYIKYFVDPKTACINMNNPNDYQNDNTTKSQALLLMPWMAFGGAETLILNFSKELLVDYELTFMTGLDSDHVWQDRFEAISQSIYHLSNMFDNKALYLEFVSNYITTRNIKVLHILHTNFFHEQLEELKKRHPDVKIIITMFNSKVDHFPSIRLYKNYIDMFTSDNEHVVREYIKLGIGKKFTRVIPNGIDSALMFNPEKYGREQLRKEYQLDEDSIAVFFIGRLSEEKNPDIFVKVAKILSKNTKFHFFMVGDGIMKTQLVKDMRNCSNISYLGYRSDIAQILRVSDVFVLPSSIEGFPLSILEAMAMESVCVASAVGAIPEIIEESKTGYIVTPGSINEIVDALNDLSNNPAKLKKMQSNSRKIVTAKYSSEILGGNYRKLYKDVRHES